MPKKISKIKKIAKKPAKTKKEPVQKEHYFEAIGRRKTAIARIRLFTPAPKKSSSAGTEIVINDRNISNYFPLKKYQDVVQTPFEALSLKGYRVTVKVKGSGRSAQAEAVRLGISRALVLLDPTWRPKLKSLGLLKRDPRMVERKKYGLRKARRPQQWRKR